jgi:hypothetical protein
MHHLELATKSYELIITINEHQVIGHKYETRGETKLDMFRHIRPYTRVHKKCFLLLFIIY